VTSIAFGSHTFTWDAPHEPRAAVRHTAGIGKGRQRARQRYGFKTQNTKRVCTTGDRSLLEQSSAWCSLYTALISLSPRRHSVGCGTRSATQGHSTKEGGGKHGKAHKKHISYTARKPGSIEWQLLESKLSPNYDTSQPLSCPGRESPSPTWAVWKTILSLPSFGAKKLSLGTRLREERHHQRQRPNGACKKPGCPVVLKSSQSSFSSIGPCSW